MKSVAELRTSPCVLQVFQQLDLSSTLSFSVPQRWPEAFAQLCAHPFPQALFHQSKSHDELPCSVCVVAFTYSYLEVIETVFSVGFFFCLFLEKALASSAGVPTLLFPLWTPGCLSLSVHSSFQSLAPRIALLFQNPHTFHACFILLCLGFCIPLTPPLVAWCPVFISSYSLDR